MFSNENTIIMQWYTYGTIYVVLVQFLLFFYLFVIFIVIFVTFAVFFQIFSAICKIFLFSFLLLPLLHFLTFF